MLSNEVLWQVPHEASFEYSTQMAICRWIKRQTPSEQLQEKAVKSNLKILNVTLSLPVTIMGAICSHEVQCGIKRHVHSPRRTENLLKVSVSVFVLSAQRKNKKKITTCLRKVIDTSVFRSLCTSSSTL